VGAGVAVARGRVADWVQADRTMATATAAARQALGAEGDIFPRIIREYNGPCRSLVSRAYRPATPTTWARRLAQERGADLVGQLYTAPREPYLAIALNEKAGANELLALRRKFACRDRSLKDPYADHRPLATGALG
jgi:hypothetical protein